MEVKDTKEINSLNEDENDFEEQSIIEKELTEEQVKIDKKKQKKTPEFYRAKIDKLLNRNDVKYKAPFSYRSLRIIGFILLFFAQAYIIYGIVSKITVDYPNWVDSLANTLQILSQFALPLFLAANFCIIMSDKKSILKRLVFYSLFALLIYISIVLLHYRYMHGIFNAILKDKASANEISNEVGLLLYGKIVNYNVFVDLALFSLFYLFFFYTPQKIKTKRGLIAFRSMSILPILFAVASSILYFFNIIGYIDLPVAILAIMPCRSLTIYVIFVILSIVIKIREIKFLSWGGTREEYNNYLKTRRNSLEISTLASIIIFVVCVIDFLIMCINPLVLLYGIGYNIYMIPIIPVIMLLDYKKQPKNKLLDILIPAIFIACVIILYFEGFLLAANLFFKT